MRLKPLLDDYLLQIVMNYGILLTLIVIDFSLDENTTFIRALIVSLLVFTCLSIHTACFKLRNK